MKPRLDPARADQVVTYAKEHGNAAALKKFGIHRSTLFAYKKRSSSDGFKAPEPPSVRLSDPEPQTEIDQLIEDLEKRKTRIEQQLQAAIQTRDLMRRKR